MINLYYADIENVLWQQIEAQINILPIQEVHKIYSLKFDRDRCLSLIGKRLLLNGFNDLIQDRLQRLPELIYNQFGKPFFKDYSIHFNISHSGSIVICALSTKGEIGTDIEIIKDINIDEYQNVLNPSEYGQLSQGNSIDFFRLWTIKEAIMKAEGKGFSMDPLSINLENINNQNSFSLNGKIWFINTKLVGKYVVSIASSAPFRPFFRELKIL